MKILNSLIIFHLTLTQASSSNFIFTDYEFNIILDLVKKLEIRQCILIRSQINNPQIISDVKKFSSAKLPSVQLIYTQAIDYISALVLNETNYLSTAILFNSETFLDLQKISIYGDSTCFKLKGSSFHHLTWLIFTLNIQLMAKIDFGIPYNCEFVLIEAEKESSYKLTEIYNVKSKTFALFLGTWDQNFGLRILDESFYWRRINLNGSILETQSLSSRECPKTYYSCLIYEIIHLWGYKMNFRLQKRLVEIADIFSEHFESIDISNQEYPYFPYWSKMMIGPIIKSKTAWFIRDQRTGLRPDYYFQPFEGNIWLALLLSVTISTTIFVTVDALIACKNKRNWIDDLFMGIETVCNQCGNDNIQKIPLRVTSIALRVTMIVLVSAYGAVITSFLAVQKPVIPFRNAEEFIDNGQFKLGVWFSADQYWTDNAFIVGSFVERNILLRKIHNNYTLWFNTEKTGDEEAERFFNKLCSENFAVMDFPKVLLQKTFPCNLLLHPEPLFEVSYAFSLSEESPFVKAFNLFFLRFYLESGIRKQQQNIYDDNDAGFDRLKFNTNNRSDRDNKYGDYLKKRLQDDSLDSVFHFVKFSQVKQVLSIPLIGVLMGIFILFCEFYLSRDISFVITDRILRVSLTRFEKRFSNEFFEKLPLTTLEFRHNLESLHPLEVQEIS